MTLGNKITVGKWVTRVLLIGGFTAVCFAPNQLCWIGVILIAVGVCASLWTGHNEKRLLVTLPFEEQLAIANQTDLRSTHHPDCASIKFQSAVCCNCSVEAFDGWEQTFSDFKCDKHGGNAPFCVGAEFGRLQRLSEGILPTDKDLEQVLSSYCDVPVDADIAKSLITKWEAYRTKAENAQTPDYTKAKEHNVGSHI